MSIKLKAPEGATSASFSGKEYPVGVDGTVEVPAEAALALYGFGFANVPQSQEEPKAQADEPAKASRKGAKQAEPTEGDQPQDNA